MSETGSALRATSDALLADLEQLEALEQRKRVMNPGHPEFTQVAAAVEEIARRVLGGTIRQRELSTTARRMIRSGNPDAPKGPIEQTAREIHVILADWRAAERRARDATPGSTEAQTAQIEAARYRDEYRAAQDAARRGK